MTTDTAAKKDLQAKIYRLMENAGVKNTDLIWGVANCIIEQYADQKREDAKDALLLIQNRIRGWDFGTTYFDLEETLDEIKKLVREADNKLRIANGQDEIDENNGLRRLEKMYRDFVGGVYFKPVHPLPNYPFLSRMTCGLSNGYYVFVGAPNVGKSAVIQNLSMDALNNPDSRVLYLSFDDSTDDTIKRLVSRQTFYQCKSGGMIGRYEKENATKIYDVRCECDGDKRSILQKAWEDVAGLQMNGRLLIYDRADIKTMDEVEYLIAKEKKNPGNLIVCIDACLKIELNERKLRGIEADDYRADFLDYLAIKYKVPLLTTHELRKRNLDDTNTLPTMDDTKGSGRYGFNAKFGAIVYPTNRPKWKAGLSNHVTCYVDKNKLMDKTGSAWIVFDRAYNFMGETDDDGQQRV